MKVVSTTNKSSRSKLFSLNNFPIIQEESHQIKLSPQSSRIAANLGLDLDQIIPKSIQMFMIENKLEKKASQEVLQLYNQFLGKQKKKMYLVKKIKDNYIKIEQENKGYKNDQYQNGKNYRGKSKNSTNDSPKKKSSMKKSSKIKLNKSQSKFKNKSLKKKKSNQNIQQKKASHIEYFGDSIQLPKPKQIPQIFNQQTKSELKVKKNKNYYPYLHNEYDDTDTINLLSCLKMQEYKSNEKYQPMQICAQKIVIMSELHRKQLRQSIELNQKQKKRLRKIQGVEKQKLGEQMVKIIKSINHRDLYMSV